MAHGESFEIINLESDEEVFEEEIESESVSVVNYDVEELSYNEYLNIRCELELHKVNQIEQLWRQREEYRKEIESLLIRKNCISHFTPFGAAFKVSEITAFKYYNSRTMADGFRPKYMELPDETKDLAYKLSLATSIDAYKRTEILELEIQKKKKKIKAVIESIIQHVPLLKTRLTTKLVIHNNAKFNLVGKNKMYDGQYCEFCERIYQDHSSLTKHTRSVHPYYFEDAVYKYFDLAIEIADDNFQTGLEMIKADTIGMDHFEVKLDPEFAKKLGNHLRSHQHSQKVNTINPIPKRFAVEDYLENPGKPSINHSSARSKEVPTRPLTASYITSYFPRAQLTKEKQATNNVPRGRALQASAESTGGAVSVAAPAAPSRTLRGLSPIAERSREYCSSSGSSAGTTGLAHQSCLSVGRSLHYTDARIYPPQFDPFDMDHRNIQLTQLDIPLHKRNGFHPVSGRLPWLRYNSSVQLGCNQYVIKQQIVQGANVKIYEANKEGQRLVLKVQDFDGVWEYYITSELQRRLANSPTSCSVMTVSCGYFYDSGSILVYQYPSHGTLLDLINSYKLKNTSMPESLVYHFSLQLLSIVSDMHECGILHADIKPDNILLQSSLTSILHSSENWTVEEVLALDKRSLKLIDFGRSIDLALYPDRTAFMHVFQDDKCPEMRDGKPWSYQLDYYGLATSIYTMLMGVHCKIIYSEAQWNVPTLKLGHNCVWRDLTTTMLNASAGSILDLEQFRHVLATQLVSSIKPREFNDKMRELELYLFRYNERYPTASYSSAIILNAQNTNEKRNPLMAVHENIPNQKVNHQTRKVKNNLEMNTDGWILQDKSTDGQLVKSSSAVISQAPTHPSVSCSYSNLGKTKVAEETENNRREKERIRSIARRIVPNSVGNQAEKISIAQKKNPSPGYFSIGNNETFLNYQRNNKEQEAFPYYWVNPGNEIHCHCFNKAKWFEDTGCFRCSKQSKRDKCCLYIPVRSLEKKMLF